MEREIMSKLVRWKESGSRKPLILKGARQVGKTFILKEFGKRYYKNMVYLNCDNDPTARQIISADYDIKRIILELGAYTKTEIHADNTLIILDEIQEAPLGLHLLKYFCENAPQYHVAAAGSLLGITLNPGESFPVGKVDIIDMFPMTFTEFLDALGEEGYSRIIRERRWENINDLQHSLTNLLRQYYFIGGMPEIVASFIAEKNPVKVRELQNNILQAYSHDISKHAPVRDVPRIHLVWQNIPSQLAKENKKFVYGALRKGARASEFEVAIQWLVDAGLAYKVYRLSKVELPLNFYIDMQAFKLYVLDCGLFGAMCNAPIDQMLISDNVFVEFKGAFSEEYVLQQLKPEVGGNICYYTNDKSSWEIDFIVQEGSRIIPMEVKAEVNVKAKSFKQFLADHQDVHGIRVSMKPYREEERFTNIPLPAVGGVLDPTR